MTESRHCPKCHAELPADAPQGLCPQCLLQAAWDSQSAAAADSASDPTKLVSPGFVPPSPESLGRLFPQLEIVELLGKGGMGAVYKARQKGLDRLVAVKILPPEAGTDPTFAERFTREARALAKLNHPQIVTVHDVGQVEGLYYFVMEFVDGINLRQLIQRRELSAEQALSIVPQICEALQYAHDEGIVHRDIKPENILLDKKGRVKIADFGLAKLLGHEAAEMSLTGTHQVMGTLRYMAPEQMQGARQVDHRADIYSLGVVFYELLTGELPIGRFAPPSRKVQIDVRLDEIVLRTLEAEPEQRYQHASDVKTDVELVGRAPVASPPAGEAVKGGVFPIRFWWRDPLDVLLTALGTAWIAGLFWLLPIVVIGFLGPFTGLANDKVSFIAVVGGSLIFLGVMAVLGLGSLESVRVDAGGLTINRYVGPSKFLPWSTVLRIEPISRWEVFRHVYLWLGLPPRASIWCGTSLGYYRIDCQNDCWYFSPRHVEPFLRAIDRCQDSIDVKAHVEHVTSKRTATAALHLRRPRLVPLLATLNLVSAILLMLVCATEEPPAFAKSVPRLWQLWGTVDDVLGFAMAAGLFAASIGLFLWKPWARKVTLGVCVFGLASFVFDAPYLARFILPDFYAEIQHTLAAESVDPDARDFVAMLTVATLIGGVMVVGLMWLVGQLVYFTRPRVVAAFESQSEQHGKFIGWLFTGAGAVIGVLSVFGPLALLLGIAALFNGVGGDKPVDPSANPSTHRAGPPSNVPTPGPSSGWIEGSDGPALTDIFAREVLELQPTQIEQVNTILQSIYAEYPAIEMQNTEQHTDDAGHIVVRINPHPGPIAQLEDRLWSQLDAILGPQQQSVARLNLKLDPPEIKPPIALSELVRPGFFGWGKQGASLEIWRVGTWYHWEIHSRGFQDSSRAPQLPEEYRRFWKEPDRLTRVKGVVMLDGQPVPDAAISFHGAEELRFDTKTNLNGAFLIAAPNQGRFPPGDYRVSITKPGLREVYASPATSGLTIKVGLGSNELNFDLSQRP